jgi:hypothetical protein
VIPKIPIGQLIVSASWAKQATDGENDVYEYETVMHRPDGTSDVIHRGEVQFLKKRFYRIDSGVIFTTHTKFQASGELVFESRIRKSGTDDDWVSQSFALDIEFVPLESNEPAVAEGANPA